MTLARTFIATCVERPARLGADAAPAREGFDTDGNEGPGKDRAFNPRRRKERKKGRKEERKKGRKRSKEEQKLNSNSNLICFGFEEFE